jgi:hypothetical protein
MPLMAILKNIKEQIDVTSHYSTVSNFTYNSMIAYGVLAGLGIPNDWTFLVNAQNENRH